MAKNNQSVAELIGINNFSANGIDNEKGEIIYFLIKPTNISVLTDLTTETLIHRLNQLLSAYPDLEMICLDARENFEINKTHLEKKAEKETNPRVRSLLMKDIIFLDDIQLRMSTAREFMFAYRITRKSKNDSLDLLNNIKKAISNQGFECKMAERKDIKKFISRYFGHICEADIDDYDGKRFVRKWIIQD